jgi:hypothetical protein
MESIGRSWMTSRGLARPALMSPSLRGELGRISGDQHPGAGVLGEQLGDPAAPLSGEEGHNRGEELLGAKTMDPMSRRDSDDAATWNRPG